MHNVHTNKKLYALLLCALCSTQQLKPLSDRTYADALFCLFFFGGFTLYNVITFYFKKPLDTNKKDIKKIDTSSTTSQQQKKPHQSRKSIKMILPKIEDPEKINKKLDQIMQQFEKQLTVQFEKQLEQIAQQLNKQLAIQCAALSQDLKKINNTIAKQATILTSLEQKYDIIIKKHNTIIEQHNKLSTFIAQSTQKKNETIQICMAAYWLDRLAQHTKTGNTSATGAKNSLITTS